MTVYYKILIENSRKDKSCGSQKLKWISCHLWAGLHITWKCLSYICGVINVINVNCNLRHKCKLLGTYFLGSPSIYFVTSHVTKSNTVSKRGVSTSILNALRLVVTGFRARKKTPSTKSVFGSMTPLSCETEKSSPRFSSPVRRQATGSRVVLRIVSVFVSLLSTTTFSVTKNAMKQCIFWACNMCLVQWCRHTRCRHTCPVWGKYLIKIISAHDFSVIYT